MYDLVCPFNRMVDCEEACVGMNHLTKHSKCARCGWNPDVSEKRIREWHRQNNVKAKLEEARRSA